MSKVTQLKTDADKTNFRKVSHFNQAFGVDRSDTPNPTVFDQNPDLVKLRLSLIKEEVAELEEAIQNKDFTEVVDALSDILYVVYGAGDSFGVDLDEAYQIVHSSNMTKLCQTEAEAQETVSWYQKNKADVYPDPAYKPDAEGKYWIVYNKSTGKVLKSINYLPADLSQFTK